MLPDELLLPYQKVWICDASRYKICEKSRQIGITWSEAFWSVLRRIENKIDHLFSSSQEDTSKEFIRYCKQWALAFQIILEDTEISIEDSRAQCLTFPNGARIVALSSSPRALRSWHGDATLDEMAWAPNGDELYAAAQPVTQWGYNLHIISTHNGNNSAFYNLVQQARIGQSPYSLHTITLYDAVDQGLSERQPGDHQKLLDGTVQGVIACRKQYVQSVRSLCLSEAHFDQEYLCVAVSATSLISPALFGLLTKDSVPDSLDHLSNLSNLSKDHFSVVYTGGELVCGIDVGRSRDLTSTWVSERVANPNSKYSNDRFFYKCVCHLLLHDQDIPTQYEQIRRIISHPNMVKVLIDQGLIGRALFDAAYNDFGDLVVGFNFTSPNKARIAERAVGFVAGNRISVPNTDLVRDDILAIRRIVNNTKGGINGGVQYDGRTKLTHCDIFWSLALSCEAGALTEGNFGFYIPGPTKRLRDTKKEQERLLEHPTVVAMRKQLETDLEQLKSRPIDTSGERGWS